MLRGKFRGQKRSQACGTIRIILLNCEISSLNQAPACLVQIKVFMNEKKPKLLASQFRQRYYCCVKIGNYEQKALTLS